MIAMFAALLLAAAPAVSSVPGCASADPAVTDVKTKLVKKRGADHYVVSAIVANIGRLAQEPGLSQRVELLREKTVLAPQPIPSLGARVNYLVAFSFDRPSADRKKPMPLSVRYVLARGGSARNNCSTTNDTLAKTF